MNKIPFELLSLQLDQLYSISIDPNDKRAIEEHCEMIAQFVEDAGWDFDDFVCESIREFLPFDPNKMN